MSRATDLAVVLYARVSEVRDERSKSVDDQLAELRSWVKREGWTVVDEQRDDDVSASRFSGGKKRAGWEKAMRTVASGKVQALLTWEFSRSTRDLKVFTELEEACRANGVLLGYSGRLHDLSTAEGGFSAGLDALLAARESHMTSERVLRASQARASRGAPHGSVPYGYRRVIESNTGATIGREIDPDTGPVVAEIVKRILEHEPVNAITTDLNRRGILTSTGKSWRAGNVTKMALRPCYAGLRVHRGEVLAGVEATWPPIITPEQHYRLLALFGSAERDKYRNDTRTKYLGSGIYRCGRDECGGRMRVWMREPGVPLSYSCRKCFRIGRLMAAVDELVEAVVIARLSRPDALDALAEDDHTDRAAARAEVARLRAEMAEAQEALRAGRLSPLDMAAYREGWEPRLAEAEREATPAWLPSELAAVAGPDAARHWRDAPITTKRAVLDALVTVTILPTTARGWFDPNSVRVEPKH